MINKPSVAKYKYTLDSDTESSRQLSTSGGLEISSIYLSAGGAAAAARIHDSISGAGAIKDSILIAANQGESTAYDPPRPIPMRKGIFIVIEQGLGAELTIIYS